MRNCLAAPDCCANTDQLLLALGRTSHLWLLYNGEDDEDYVKGSGECVCAAGQRCRIRAAMKGEVQSKYYSKNNDINFATTAGQNFNESNISDTNTNTRFLITRIRNTPTFDYMYSPFWEQWWTISAKS